MASIMSRNTEMDGENGDGEIQPVNAKMTPDLLPLEQRKEYLPLPTWLQNDYMSMVGDLEGWTCFQVARPDYSRRKDKYYAHRDYAYTFRSKNEVQHFLDTGEAKGKILQKKLAGDPSRQSSGSRHPTKRTMLLPTNNDPPRRPIDFADYLRRPKIGGMLRGLTKDQYPPGFL